MGLFDFLHASKAARDEKRAMREFAEEKRKAEQKRRAEEEAQRTEEARILREHEVPPAMACPEYDLGPFPFDNKPYLCHTVVKYERETGQVFADERSYYGDADAVAAVKANVAKLERMLTPAVTGVPSLPSLRTNFARVEAVDSVVKVPENRVMLSLHPLTKTGKNAKYPVEVFFSSYGKNDNGSHGTVSYLRDGSMGKAVIHYWRNHVYYGAYFKIIDGAIALNVLNYRAAPDDDPVELYRA